MEYFFEYEKKKVIQGLRYHFVQRKEIRVLLVLVNVFAIVAAILFYTKKIRPEPFLLGSLIWLGMMAAFWYILPNSIYKRSATFKDSFRMQINDGGIVLENERGAVHWDWKQFSNYFESPHFFHLYFDSKSFFLLPKQDMEPELQHLLRGYLKR